METRLKIATVASISSVVIAAIALTLSPAGATNSFWYPDSDEFSASSKIITEVEARNYVDVNQGGSQTATSGDVNASHMDDIKGNATTGNASNMGTSNVSVAVSNKATAPAVAAPVAPAATVLEEFDDVTLSNFVKTEVSSKNDVDVNNNVNQTATSGSVNIHCLDDATGLATGSAANTLTMSTSVTASN